MALKKLKTVKTKRVYNTKNLELWYYKKIKEILEETKKEIEISLIPELPNIINEWKESQKVNIRQDDAASKVFNIIQATRLFLERRGRSQKIQDLGKSWAENVEGLIS